MDPNRTGQRAASALFVTALALAFIGSSLEAQSPSTGTSYPSQSTSKRDPQTARRVYGGMPLRFERPANADGKNAEFIARGAGYSMQLAASGASLWMSGMNRGPSAALTMRLVGGSEADGAGRRVLPGVTNYFIGSDPRQWRKGVRSYAEVEYRGVYPGVDIVYYGNQRQLEYDFIVAPGASPRSIALAFEGSNHLTIDKKGNLLVETIAGTLVQHAPVIYQEKSGGRTSVRGGYALRRDGRIGFDVRSYDRNLPLVIDPVLTYATYLGGAREERVAGLAFDAHGNMYVAGLTGAADFPATGSPAIRHWGGENWDTFVVKLNPAGDQFLYAAYIGGTGYEEPKGLAVDAAGNAYVTGQTYSYDFPTINAIQSSLRGLSDTFVARLDADGGIVYSTYLGGTGEDGGSGIAVDALGRAYVTGSTISADFPAVSALQSSLGGHPAFRTTDGGQTWAGIGSGLLATWVRALAIDPSNPQIVYAGSYSEGVFRSTDGGSTWMATSAELPAYPTNGIAVDSTGALFVGNDAGLWRSRDHGDTWTMLPLWMPVSALAIDTATRTLYAGAPDWYHLGVFKSTDGGDSWSDTVFAEAVGISSLAVSQSVIYAGTSNGVFKNVGGAWAPASGDIHEAVTSVAVDSQHPDVAYAGTNSALFFTTSGGAAWSATLPYPIYNVVVAPSNPSIVYVATWYGAGRTEDGGLSAPIWGIDWQMTAPQSANLYAFAIDPTDARRVYGGGTVGWDSFVSRISADGSRLEYSTFIGGAASEWGTDVAVDSSGAAYIAGITQSTDFPVRNAFQASAGGLMDVFVSKISDTGSLVYSTYLGGSSSDYDPRIAVDTSGQAHVVGLTLSANFPTANAFQPTHGGGYYDVFATTLNASGTGLVYSTYLGGNDQEDTFSQTGGPAVAVGPSGDAFVTGSTRSTNFPTRDAIQSTYGGGLSDAFVAHFDAAGQLVYSTYVGGTGADFGARVAVDGTGDVAIAGATDSTDFQTRHAIQSSNAGAEDVFVARIGPGSAGPDTTPPTSGVSLAGTAGSNGWFKSSVTVTLRAADDENGTGVAFVDYSLNGGVWQRYTGPFVVSAQGTTIVRARATDRAGNVQNQDASSTFMIDSAGPALTLMSPAATEYPHTASFQVSFGATDSVSGLAGAAVATLDGLTVANGQTIQVLTLSLGTHIVTVSASDRAGNSSATGIGFTVIANMDTLIDAVNTFVASGQIDASVGRSLLSKLNDAKQLLSRGNLTGALGKLGDFKNLVAAKSGQGIAPGTAQLLMADADYVIGTLQ